MGGRRFDDNFISTVLEIIERAANTGSPCPSNEALAHSGGFKSMSSGARAVLLLEERGAITVKRASCSRIITVVSTGKSTGGKLTKIRTYGKGSRPPVDPLKRKQHPRRHLADHSAGHVYGPPLPADMPLERTSCPRCGVRSDIGCRHVEQEVAA